LYPLLIYHESNLDVCELPIRVTTISHRLKSNGIHGQTAAKKEFLNDAHKRNRLEFTTAYVNKTQEWRDKVIFSDEKSFGLVLLSQLFIINDYLSLN
jgi:hypothetical protein